MDVWYISIRSLRYPAVFPLPPGGSSSVVVIDIPYQTAQPGAFIDSSQPSSTGTIDCYFVSQRWTSQVDSHIDH